MGKKANAGTLRDSPVQPSHVNAVRRKQSDAESSIPQTPTKEGLSAVTNLLNAVQQDSSATLVLMHRLDDDVQKRLSELLFTEPHLQLAEKTRLMQDELARLQEALNVRSDELNHLSEKHARNTAALSSLQTKERQYLEVVHGFILTLDADLNVTSINSGGKTTLGLHDEEILGKSWVDTCVVKSYVPEVRTLLNKQLAGDGPQSLEYPVLTRGGEERIVSWKLIANTSTHPPGLLCAGEDITMLRQLNLALEMSEERLHLVMESEREDEFFIMDTEGYIVSWISRPEEGKNFRAEETIGKHFSSFYVPDDFQSGKPMRILEIAERDGRYEEESWRVRKDGSRMKAYVIIIAIRDDEKKLLGFSNVTRYLHEKEQDVKPHLLKIPAHLVVTR